MVKKLKAKIYELMKTLKFGDKIKKLLKVRPTKEDRK